VLGVPVAFVGTDDAAPLPQRNQIGAAEDLGDVAARRDEQRNQFDPAPHPIWISVPCPVDLPAEGRHGISHWVGLFFAPIQPSQRPVSESDPCGVEYVMLALN
jgi:hypothetical protein